MTYFNVRVLSYNFFVWNWNELREIWSRVTDFGQKCEAGNHHNITQKCQCPVFMCATARWCYEIWPFLLVSLQAGNYSISPGHLLCKHGFVCCNVCLEIERPSAKFTSFTIRRQQQTPTFQSVLQRRPCQHFCSLPNQWSCGLLLIGIFYQSLFQQFTKFIARIFSEVIVSGCL